MTCVKTLQTKLFNAFDALKKIEIRNIDIFYILLTIFTLLYLYYSFFDSVLYCDYDIQELKDNIQGDLSSLKEACHDYETLSHMHNIQKLRILHSGNSLSFSNINLEIIARAFRRKSEAHAIISNIWCNTTIIRIKEPGFKPPLELIL
jgi:hypothetical protein